MSYQKYLQSDHWKDIKTSHKEAGLSEGCISCGDTRIQLHHRTYARKGEELLLDLLPLCGVCHTKVHEYAKEHKMKIQATHKILRLINGWTKKETRKRFEGFSKSKKGFRWN